MEKPVPRERIPQPECWGLPRVAREAGRPFPSSSFRGGGGSSSHTAPGKAPKGPARLPSRPAHLAAAPVAVPGTAMGQPPPSSGGPLPRTPLREESKEHLVGGRGAGPPRPQRRAAREEGAGLRSHSRKRPTPRKEPESAECYILSTLRLQRPLLDRGGFLFDKNSGEKWDYFMTSISDAECRCFIHSPTEATVIFYQHKSGFRIAGRIKSKCFHGISDGAFPLNFH